MKKVFGILLVLVIAALIFALLYFKGFGGFGKDSGENKKNDSVVSQTTEQKTEAESETTTENATEAKTDAETVDITVSGRDYLFNNEKITLEEFAAELGKFDKETKIVISYDDTAAKNAMDELTDHLDELGYKNYEKEAK